MADPHEQMEADMLISENERLSIELDLAVNELLDVKDENRELRDALNCIKWLIGPIPGRVADMIRKETDRGLGKPQDVNTSGQVSANPDRCQDCWSRDIQEKSQYPGSWWCIDCMAEWHDSLKETTEEVGE